MPPTKTTPPKKTIIIGGGIAGLSAAFLLSQHGPVILYEKEPRPGGHARTITAHCSDGELPVDTGFIVLNDRNYPQLNGLFTHLAVEIENSDMSFGVSINDGWLEYSSSNIFAQKRNLARPAFLKMLRDILRFNQTAKAVLNEDLQQPLGKFIKQQKLGPWFRDYYLLAMGAAIWSTPIKAIEDYPAATFLRFFENHGLLNLRDRPQWKTVTGGSQRYVSKLIEQSGFELRLNSPITSIKRQGGQWQVIDQSGNSDQADHLILACHADRSHALLPQDCPQRASLSSFKFQPNRVITHKDISFMPKRKSAWSSWNYLQSHHRHTAASKPAELSLSYWMNNLQNLKTKDDIIITLNPAAKIRDELIIDETSFTHPVFDQAAIEAQQKISQIQGQDNLWFAGAWLRYGFHEDGILSAVNIARAMGHKIPWETPDKLAHP